MRRGILVLAMIVMIVGLTPLSASAGADKCFNPLYTGYWSGCMHLVGSKLHVDKVTSEFRGIKNSYYDVYLKHRLCIDLPSGIDPCYYSGIRHVVGYSIEANKNVYDFQKGGDYLNNTIMCTYIYQTNSTGGNLVKKVGPLCATIHS